MSSELDELRARVAALEEKLSGKATLDHLVAQRVDVVKHDGTRRLADGEPSIQVLDLEGNIQREL